MKIKLLSKITRKLTRKTSIGKKKNLLFAEMNTVTYQNEPPKVLILSLNVFSLCGESEKDGPKETKGGKVDH